MLREGDCPAPPACRSVCISEIRLYRLDESKPAPFNAWFGALWDRQAMTVIDARLARVRRGNFW